MRLHLGLLRDLLRVVDLNSEVPDRALKFAVAEEELNGPEIPGPPVDQRRLVRRIEWVPYAAGSSPIDATHDPTIRDYCRVERCGDFDTPLRNRNCYDFKFAAAIRRLPHRAFAR